MTWAHGFRDSPCTSCCLKVTECSGLDVPKVARRSGPGANARVAKIGPCAALIPCKKRAKRADCQKPDKCSTFRCADCQKPEQCSTFLCNYITFVNLETVTNKNPKSPPNHSLYGATTSFIFNFASVSPQ